MFGAKYSRLIFWSISIVLFIVFAIASSFSKYFASTGQNDNAIIFSVAILVVDFIWINTLANRIRDYGDNPWIALFALIPFANIGLALFYGIVKSKNKESQQEEKVNSNEISLTKAVYNHTKDIVSEIKPTINEYKENHTTSNNNPQNNNINVNESKIYEDIMNEIEQDNKVKSTWARALSQSDGNKDKAEALYISMRFEELKYQQSYQKEELNLKYNSPISTIINKEYNRTNGMKSYEINDKKDWLESVAQSFVQILLGLLFFLGISYLLMILSN